MSSWVELANIALAKIGHMDFISSLTDDRKAALLINKNYLQTRDYVLRAHNWNFATKRAILSADVTPPEWGHGNYFTHPSDWIRTVQVGEYGYRYEWDSENGKIRFDGTELNLRYIYRVEDPNKFDAHFAECYTSRLAYNISMGLAVDANLRNSLLAMYDKDLRKAMSVDGLERGVHTMESNDFINYRQ